MILFVGWVQVIGCVLAWGSRTLKDRWNDSSGVFWIKEERTTVSFDSVVDNSVERCLDLEIGDSHKSCPNVDDKGIFNALDIVVLTFVLHLKAWEAERVQNGEETGISVLRTNQLIVAVESRQIVLTSEDWGAFVLKPRIEIVLVLAKTKCNTPDESQTNFVHSRPVVPKFFEHPLHLICYFIMLFSMGEPRYLFIDVTSFGFPLGNPVCLRQLIKLFVSIVILRGWIKTLENVLALRVWVVRSQLHFLGLRQRVKGSHGLHQFFFIETRYIHNVKESYRNHLTHNFLT